MSEPGGSGPDLATLRDDLARLYGEDVAQETVLKLLETQATGETVEQPEHWCRRTAFRLRKHEQRRRWRQLPWEVVGDVGNTRANHHGGPGGGPGRANRLHEDLVAPARQQTRLEAQEMLARADSRLIEEAVGDGQVRSKDARKRMRRQASPHPHRPRRNRPGRCSRCGLGREAEVHGLGREVG